MPAVSMSFRVNFEKLRKYEEAFKAAIEEELYYAVESIVKSLKTNHKWLNRTGCLESSIAGVIFRGGRYSSKIVSDHQLRQPRYPYGKTARAKMPPDRRYIGEALGRQRASEFRYTGGQVIAAAIVAGAEYAAFLEGKVTKKGAVLHVIGNMEAEFERLVRAAVEDTKWNMDKMNYNLSIE